ncbi:MAG: DUF4769 domain-containing protein [Acidimicrobiaceae bacterium]|nr:DUF4769 domain-containing protein [Acidimicrobiaceae bacterium]
MANLLPVLQSQPCQMQMIQRYRRHHLSLQFPRFRIRIRNRFGHFLHRMAYPLLTTRPTTPVT